MRAMSLDLGARLLRAGLLGPAELSRAGVGSCSALARTLVQNGLREDALAGFFVAEGAGPVVTPDALQGVLVSGDFPLSAMEANLALPIAKAGKKWVVAMAVPDDDDTLREIQKKLGTEINARVALISDILRTIEKQKQIETARLNLASENSDSLIPARMSEAAPIALTRRRAARRSTPPQARITSDSDSTQVRMPRPKRDTWGDATVHASTKRVADARRPSARPAAPQSRLAGTLQTFDAMISALEIATSLDEAARIACQASQECGRTAVYFQVRKEMLVGIAGVGENIDEAKIRRVMLPPDPGSIFRPAWVNGEHFSGACGVSPADALYLSAIDGDGASVRIEPVFAGGRVAGLLALDNAKSGALSDARIEAVSVALGEALERIGK